MSNKKLIPEFRFPEFKNEGEWIVKELNDFCFNISSGKDKNSDVGIYELYGSTGIIGRTDIASYNGDYILVARVGANAGLLNRAKGKFGVTDNTLVLDLKKVDIIDFIQYSLYKAGLNKLVFGSGQPLITGGQLKSLQIATTKNPKEQQKIASCLSSLDEVIAAHSQKLDVLKDHKKGLMQNLFPQEGEKMPKYRFKEFENDGDWVEKTIEEICDVNPTSNQLPLEFVYIDLESVENGILKKENKITLEGAPSRAQRLLKRNDVIYQMVRPYQMNNYFFQVESEIKFVASTGYAQLRAFESSEFLFQLIHTEDFVGKVLAKCTGSNYPAINSSDLKLIELQIPPSPKEQQKIASCLSSLDVLITAQAEKIEQLQLHKKGLMQGLFPKINE